MRNNKMNIGLIALSAMLATGCDDAAFLRETPETSYAIESVFSSSNQVQQVVTSCYEKVRDIFCTANPMQFSARHFYMGNDGTDMFDVPSGREAQSMNDYSKMGADFNIFSEVYNNFYQLVSRANLAISAAEEVTWDSEEAKAQTLAEAHFFRAYAYMNLGELYGGVPLVAERITEPCYDFARSTRVETYQFAIDDLEKYSLALPETTGEAGRLVKGAVQHYLCQLYIDKGVALEEEGQDGTESFRKAKEYADAVIDGGTYSLMLNRFGTRQYDNPKFYYATNDAAQTEDHTYESAGVHIEGNVFWDLFQEGNQDYQSGNTEAIWVAQMSLALCQQSYTANRMAHSCNYSPVARDVQGELMGNKEDVGGEGVTAVMPTEYTRDLIWADKWGDDMRNSDAVFRRSFVGNMPDGEWYGKLLPWDVIHKVKDGVKDEWAYTFLFPISCKIASDVYSGYEAGLDGNLSYLYRDDYLVRLPETILLRAEVKWRLGDNQGAADDINMLRDRAQCGYRVVAGDVNLDLILDERARELMYEEHRWNTLLRMGGTVAKDRIYKYSYWDVARTSLDAKPDFNLWPIPQSVIDVNKDVVLEQNPGW